MSSKEPRAPARGIGDEKKLFLPRAPARGIKKDSKLIFPQQALATLRPVGKPHLSNTESHYAT